MTDRVDDFHLDKTSREPFDIGNKLLAPTNIWREIASRYLLPFVYNTATKFADAGVSPHRRRFDNQETCTVASCAAGIPWIKGEKMRGEKMRCAFLIAALAGTLMISPASATIRIAGDGGGQIGAYIQRHAAMRQSGERVVIDGPCLSACTMVLGAIPRSRICVTSRAVLGFHAAYDLDQSGQQVTSYGGTSLLMAHYPQHVRKWIARRGGLSRQMMFLSGRTLSSMYAPCDSFAGQDGGSASRPVVGAGPDFTPSAQATWRRQKGGRTAAHKLRRTRHGS